MRYGNLFKRIDRLYPSEPVKITVHWGGYESDDIPPEPGEIVVRWCDEDEVL